MHMPNANGQQERTATKRRPIHEIGLGSMRAAIWRNETASGTPIFNATFSRVYKDREGNWQTSESFGKDELPLLGKVVDLAFEWIFYQGQAAASETE